MAMKICHSCGGRGRYRKSSRDAFGNYYSKDVYCGYCHGTGQVDDRSSAPIGTSAGDGRGGGDRSHPALPFEDRVAQLPGIAAFGFTFWYGLTRFELGDYWWVLGTACAAGGWATTWVLSGPLRWLLSFTRLMLKLAFWGAGIAILVYLFAPRMFG